MLEKKKWPCVNSFNTKLFIKMPKTRRKKECLCTRINLERKSFSSSVEQYRILGPLPKAGLPNPGTGPKKKKKREKTWTEIKYSIVFFEA